MWRVALGYLEAVALPLSGFVAAAGLVALALVAFRWKWVGRVYQEHWAKLAVGFFRFMAATAAVAGRNAPPADSTWVATLAVAGVGYLLWEWAGALGDAKHKAGKDKAVAELRAELATTAADREAAEWDREDALLQSVRRTWLLTHLRRAVCDKRRRVHQIATASADARASIQQVRQGLAPAEQVRILLECLASLFHFDANRFTDRPNQNFRIGLYAEQDGRLEPIDAFDYATRRHDPFVSYAEYADRFRLDNEASPSHAVRCVREGRTLIVADCGAEPGFEFFHQRQHQYLRSLVAHPLAGFCPDGLTPARAALLIDTNVPEHFREDDRELIEDVLNEFAARIDLEYAISGLIG